MKQIYLSRENIYKGNLILVNARYPFRDVAAPDMIPADARFPEILLKQEAAKALQSALKKIAADDAIVPVSGYRSLEEQSEIFNNSLKENGEEFTRKYVALPNHSEHQTGLAIDLGLNQPEIDFIRPDFPYEGICNAFRKAAPDFGFVERYQKDKEKITGISQEPWHFRYVGYPHSKIMDAHRFSLEEYTDFLKSFRVHNKYEFKEERNHDGNIRHQNQANTDVIAIYYIPYSDVLEKKDMTSLLPEHPGFRISGNNVDGFIITVFRGIS